VVGMCDMSTLQVHVRTRPCFGRTNVTCNCAVAFRENNNVLGVFACQRGEPPKPVRYLIDGLSPPGDITVNRGGNEYLVRLLQLHQTLLNHCVTHTDTIGCITST